MLKVSANVCFQSPISLKLFIWSLVVISLFFDTQSVVAKNGYRMVQVRRFMESPIRNSFKLESVTQNLCTGVVCERRNSYWTGGRGTLTCQCQCKSLYVYSSSVDKCIFSDEKGTSLFSFLSFHIPSRQNRHKNISEGVRFCLFQYSKYRQILSKIHSYRLLFRRLCPLGFSFLFTC